MLVVIRANKDLSRFRLPKDNTLLPLCLIYIKGVDIYNGDPGEMVITLGFGC